MYYQINYLDDSLISTCDYLCFMHKLLNFYATNDWVDSPIFFAVIHRYTHIFCEILPNQRLLSKFSSKKTI